MNQALRFPKTFLSLGLILALAFFAMAGLAYAENKAEKKIEILLVWGTNEDKSPDETHKLLDGEVARKLKKTFKWENYFLIKTQEVQADGQKFELSKQCSLQMKDIGGGQLEVDIWGKGKPVRKIKEKVTCEDWLVVAGDDRNDSAWFILFKEVK